MSGLRPLGGLRFGLSVVAVLALHSMRNSAGGYSWSSRRFSASHVHGKKSSHGSGERPAFLLNALLVYFLFGGLTALDVHGIMFLYCPLGKLQNSRRGEGYNTCWRVRAILLGDEVLSGNSACG